MTVLLTVLLICTFKTETYKYWKECTLETKLETIYKKQVIKQPSLKHHLKVLLEHCKQSKDRFLQQWKNYQWWGKLLFQKRLERKWRCFGVSILSDSTAKSSPRKSWTARTSWDSNSHQQDDLVYWHFALSCNVQELLHFKNFFFFFLWIHEYFKKWRTITRVKLHYLDSCSISLKIEYLFEDFFQEIICLSTLLAHSSQPLN